jgi:WD40 repeat protein
VKRDELRRQLERIELSDEHEARERAWQLMHAAFAEREPAPRTRAFLRPALALAVLAALVAAALSPPGQALIDSVREAIGVEQAAPQLFDLPAQGRVLVSSARGVWIVHPDGSKRLLGRYREASWSPNGLYVVAARANELVAIDPESRELRWTLARRNVRRPRWGGTRTDTRIAYLSGATLRVVAGDGRPDRALVRAPDLARTPLAWRPGAGHVLAYATQGILRVVETDSDGEELWNAHVAPPRVLAWSGDGRRLLAVSSGTAMLFSGAGRRLSTRRLPADAVAVDAAFEPRSYRYALVLRFPRGDRSEVRIGPRRIFWGAGRFDDLAWSPDGDWLLVAWRDADQWVFLRSAGVRRLEAVSSISRQFRSRTFPALDGWCCPAAR